MPASPPTSCSDRAFSPMEHVTIHFGFKMLFFTVSLLCICSLATLSIILLFKQISLSQRESGERYPIILSFFFGERKRGCSDLCLSKYIVQIILTCVYCFAFSIKF